MPEHDALNSEPHDIFAALTHADPAPFYPRLRARAALYRDESSGLWVAVCSDAILTAFGHPGLRVRPSQEPVPRALLGTAAGEVFKYLVRMNDGAFHAQHKPGLRAEVAALKLDRIRQLSSNMTPTLLKRFSSNDLLAELPVRVMASALGVADALLDDVAGHVRTFTRGIAAGASAAVIGEASVAATALRAYWRQRGFDEIEAAQRIGLMQQSLDATAGLLGNTILSLQRLPERAAKWMMSHENAREWVAEVARWDAPIQNTRRFACGPVTLLNQSIADGECVLLVLASGNRDAALNERPDEFDPGRKNRRSLTFGSAAHQCPADKIAIEIIAACARFIWANGRFDACFRHSGAYLELPNARVPVFDV